MPLRRRLRTLALVGCIAAVTLPQTAFAEEPTAANVAAARKHFEKARAFYGQGSYREAISELDAAHALDPNAKDLVFNLGVVHEKLADIDEALKWFKLYTTMDLVAQERDRADAYIKRLEGAKRELEAKQSTPPPSPDSSTAAPPEPGAAPRPPGPDSNPSSHAEHPSPVLPAPAVPPSSIGRIDGWTIGGAGLTAAALAFGVVMGVKAMGDRPASGLVTPRDLTEADLRSRTDQAFHEGLLADAGFGAALVAGVATSYLYLGRSRSVTAAPGRSTTFLAGPLSRGGALFLEGRF